MDTYRDQARETDYDLRYRRFNDAPSDSPPLPGPCDRVRRDTLLPLYPRSQEPQPQRGKQCYPPRESQNLSQILSQLDDRVTSIARVLEFGLCLIWRHLYLVGLWHGFDVVMVLGFVYGLPYWRIVDYHARHWRRHWVLSILLYGLLFCSANLEYHLRYTRAAMKPPAYDAFHPACPPTFMAATCPEILRVPRRIYPRLLEPSSSISSYYKQMMKCWHPDKIHFHPSRVADRYAKDIRAILALCRDRMSLGEGYPRSIWSRDYRDRIEINKSGLWNASAVHTNLDFEELNLNPVDNRFAFPQSPKPCICDIDTAVSNLLRSLFIPPWSTFYTTKDTLPRTLEQLVNYCACDIQTAWEPFHRVFNISISPPRIIQYTYLLSWIDIPQDLQIALGWVVLKANVPWYHPVSLVLSTFLPVSTIQAFYTYNLPPRGAHIFCFDAQGLPRDSMRKIDVPDPWTDQLRRYGRDGLDLTSDMGIRRRNWSYGERSACLKRGWCFEGEVGVPFRGVGRDLW